MITRTMMMETESGKFHYLYIVLSSYYTADSCRSLIELGIELGR